MSWSKKSLSETAGTGESKEKPADFGSWIQENVWAPTYNTLVVETHNAARQTINSLTNSEVIKDRLDPLKTTEANIGSLEWWSQNICSGLAAAGVYAVAGKVTGGGLRGIAGGAEKLAVPLLTSKLAYKNRAVAEALGKAGNAITRITVNDKTAMILGAGLYDGSKELKDGETNAGNAAGGMACFGILEAGNAYIGSKFKLAGSLGLAQKAKLEAAKAATRLVPGALGSGAHILASHAVSRQELPTDGKVWSDSLVTGAAMNVVLPWAQHGLGKGIDAATKHMPAKIPFVPKAIPVERYRSNVDSPLLKELRSDLPLSRVKVGQEIKAEGQDGRIHLSKGATEAQEAHELWHIKAKRNMDRAHELREVNELIKENQLADAKEKYIALRIKEEVLANEVEQAVQSGRKDIRLGDIKWDSVDSSHPLWRQVAADAKYQQQFQSDFNKLVSNKGKPIVETDYISAKLRELIDARDVDGAIEYLFPKMDADQALLLKAAANKWGKSHPQESPVNALVGLKASAFVKVLTATQLGDTKVGQDLGDRITQRPPAFSESLSEMYELQNKLDTAWEAKEDLERILEEVVAERVRKFDEVSEREGDEFTEDNRDHDEYIYESDKYEIPESLRKKLIELDVDPDIAQDILDEAGLDSDNFGLYETIVQPRMDEYETVLGEKNLATLLEHSDLFEEGVGDHERRHLPSDSFLRLAKVFGNQADVWIQKQRQLGRTFHDYTYWLPDCPASELPGLPEFLMRNYRRRTPELEMIANRWKYLSIEEQKLSVDEILEVLRQRVYPNIKLQEFANEAVKYGVSEQNYNEYERRFIESQSVSSPFPLESLWSQGDLQGHFLPRSDVRGVFLGQYTNCCQHPDSQGRACAWYGQEKPNSGFFVVKNAKTGEIVAQSWAWVTEDGGLCFDNIEGTRDCNYKYDQEVGDMYQAVANELSSQYHTITLGTQSTDIRLDRWAAAEGNTLQPPADFGGMFRDSKKQVLLAKGNSKPVESAFLQLK